MWCWATQHFHNPSRTLLFSRGIEMLISQNLLAIKTLSGLMRLKCMLNEKEKPVLALGAHVMLHVLYKSKEQGRNQLPSELQDTWNMPQRKKFSLYSYIAWPHFSRMSWIHTLTPRSSLSTKRQWFALESSRSWPFTCSLYPQFSFPGSSRLWPDHHRFSLVALSTSGLGPAVFFAMVGQVSLLLPFLSETNLISFCFLSTSPSEHSCSRYCVQHNSLRCFISFTSFCKLSIYHWISPTSPAFWCYASFLY